MRVLLILSAETQAKFGPAERALYCVLFALRDRTTGVVDPTAELPRAVLAGVFEHLEPGAFFSLRRLGVLTFVAGGWCVQGTAQCLRRRALFEQLTPRTQALLGSIAWAAWATGDAEGAWAAGSAWAAGDGGTWGVSRLTMSRLQLYQGWRRETCRELAAMGFIVVVTPEYWVLPKGRAPLLTCFNGAAPGRGEAGRRPPGKPTC